MLTVNCTGLEQQEKLERPISHAVYKAIKSYNGKTKDFMHGTLEIKRCNKCLDLDLITGKHFCNIRNEKYSYLQNTAIKYLQYPLLSPSLQLQLK